MTRKPEGPLRRGWTTGACATAATTAAFTALITGEFTDPVEILLPKGERPSFALARRERGEDWATAGIIKDAGDDPDVTHLAMIVAKVRALPSRSGVLFTAGEGVGTVTKAGLPVPVGEPAINPVPRQLMAEVIGFGSGRMIPQSPTMFAFRGAVVEFVANENGGVTYLIVHAVEGPSRVRVSIV
jgi:cobalt-precorrin-5B (C1)-methyltransferase